MLGRERIQYKDDSQILRCARRDSSSQTPFGRARSDWRSGITTADLDEIAAGAIATAGATPSFLGYRRLSGDDLRLGQRRGGSRHPWVTGADGGRRRVGGLRCDRRRAGTATRRSARSCRRLMATTWRSSRSTEQAMWAGIAALATGERLGSASARRSRTSRTPVSGTASCGSTSGTASAPRCTRRLRCSTTVRARRGPVCGRGCASRSSRCSPGSRGRPGCWRTTGPWSPSTGRARRTGSTRSRSVGRSLGAHRARRWCGAAGSLGVRSAPWPEETVPAGRSS